MASFPRSSVKKCAVRLVLLGLAYFFTMLSTPVIRAQSAGISFVQANSATPQASQTAVTVTYSAAQAAGDLNVVAVGWNDTTAQITSVTDTAGNVYALAVGPTVQNGIATQAIFYAKNITATVAGGNTVTVAFSTNARFADIRIAEYSGIDPGNPQDVSIAEQGNATSRRHRNQRLELYRNRIRCKQVHVVMG